jgi:dienelactone hydrolase
VSFVKEESVRHLLTRFATAALGCLLAAPCSAGEPTPARPPWKAPKVVSERTADGTVYSIVASSSRGPAPTLFLFAGTGEGTLGAEAYGRVGMLLQAQGWNVVSLDLPCHGAQQRKGEQAELSGWAERVGKGEDIAAELSGRVNQVLDHLVKKQVADPERVAAAGTSRGGFMAFHLAAANPRIRAVAGFAPVTDLLALGEFGGLKDKTLAQKLSLANAAGKLADRAAWITIGNDDKRVGTDRATAFAKALTQAAEQQKLRPRVQLQVLPVPGHGGPPEWHDQAAAWLLTAMLPPAAEKKP